jgi:hypothetical protein
MSLSDSIRVAGAGRSCSCGSLRDHGSSAAAGREGVVFRSGFQAPPQSTPCGLAPAATPVLADIVGAGPNDNGTSLDEARRSPAESARRWRPASALGRPVSPTEEGSRGASTIARGEQESQVAARLLVPNDNGTSLGEVRRSPAESARRWRPASALGRPVSPDEEGSRGASTQARGEQLGRPAVRLLDPNDNGTSLGEARRSPAESARRWRPASALGRPVSPTEEGSRGASTHARGEQESQVAARLLDANDNGTSLGEARRSPAESARRWRPASALGRPVSPTEEGSRGASTQARGEQESQVAARLLDAIDNGTSLGEARRSPAESARRWRPASALGRPVSPTEEGSRGASTQARGEQESQVAARLLDPNDNGTSLDEVRRSPAESARRWRPASALGRPVSPDEEGSRGASTHARGEQLGRPAVRLLDLNDNGTSLGEARRSPAESARRWRPASALGRPVSPDEEGSRGASTQARGEQLGRPAVRLLDPNDNGTSLGEARRSPAESARRWRPASALGRPVSPTEEGSRGASTHARGEQPGRLAVRLLDPNDNGTSLDEVRRSPAESARRWRPASALGRPVALRR